MFREKVKKVAKKLKNPNGFSSTIASVFKILPKKFQSAKKRRRGDLLGFFCPVGRRKSKYPTREHQNTFRDIKKFLKKSLPMPKKTVKPNLLSCIVKKSVSTNTHWWKIWKHSRVLFGQVGRTMYSEILIKF